MRRIFVLGTNQVNFIYLLAKSIKALDAGIAFSSLSFNFGRAKPPDDLNTVFDPIYPRAFNPVCFLVSIVRSLGQAIFWRILLFILFVEFKPAKAVFFWYQWNMERSFFLKENLSDVSIYQFHYMQYSYIRPVWFVSKKAKVVCTFWGSDLLRTSDPLNHFIVQKALERADAITTQSEELREIVLAKFGRSLRPKVRILKLTLDTAIVDKIDELKGLDRSEILVKLGLPEARVVILAGHNASPFNNHKAILEAVNSLKPEVKKDVLVVIPFAYGSGELQMTDYRKGLEELIRKSPVSVRFLNHHLADEQVAMLRIAVDIMVHIPDSDALSGAATECMYAGNVLITGSWLPYGPFRRAGLFYKECDSPGDLREVMNAAIENLDDEKRKSSENREQVRAHFFPEKTAAQWISMFYDLVPS